MSQETPDTTHSPAAASNGTSRAATVPPVPEQDRRTFVPQVDIVEVPDGIVLYADLPGLAEDQLDVTVDRNLLTIRGRIAETVPEGYEPLHQEYGVGDYERAFTLSNEVDRDGIAARFENGVLRLHLPKTRQPAPRKILVGAPASAAVAHSA
jgi:HSP20 family protein